MFAFAVQIFEYVRAWLTLFYFKPWWIGFEVGLTTPYELLIVFGFVRIIALDAL